jgi:hypothetical protein
LILCREVLLRVITVAENLTTDNTMEIGNTAILGFGQFMNM